MLVADNPVPVDEEFARPTPVPIGLPSIQLVVLRYRVLDAEVGDRLLHVRAHSLEQELRRVYPYDNQPLVGVLGVPLLEVRECPDAVVQVYVQKSMRTTFPRRSAILSGSELIQPEIPANSGAVGWSESVSSLVSTDTVGDDMSVGSGVGIVVGVAVGTTVGISEPHASVHASRKSGHDIIATTRDLIRGHVPRSGISSIR